MSYNPYNPYMNYFTPNPDLSNLVAQNMNVGYPNASMGQRGDFVEIKDDRVIDNYPARTDGVPTLFFNYSNMTFTSKKLINGKTCQQTFQFAPVNATSPDQIEEVKAEAQPAPDKTKEILLAILDKLDAFDKSLTKTNKEVTKLKNLSKEAAK